MGAVEAAMLAAWFGVQPRKWRRYIDDIFFLWNGTEEELIEFINHLNRFHPFLRFKSSYNFTTKSVNVLDTVISITDAGFIKTTLYTKPGKKCTYLLPKSCHPSHICDNIPFSLGLRLLRICSDEDDFKNHLTVLKETLQSRGYRKKSIENAFSRVLLINRHEALKKREKKKVDMTALPIPYDPRLPNISSILHRFWKVMVSNPRLKRIFPNPPMVCWSRPRNLKDILIRAKVQAETNRRSERTKPGFQHCRRDCMMCKYSPNFCKQIISSTTGESFPITSSLSCVSENVIYCLTCTKGNRNCKEKPQYIGETGRRICDRFQEHRGTITNLSQRTTTKPVGEHFHLPGHSIKDIQIIPIEKVRSDDPWIRKAREQFYIRKFDTSLNKKF